MRGLSVFAAFFVIFTAYTAWAKIGQEFHISSTGEVHIVAGEVILKHALNLISVEVWDQKWIVPLDQYTKLESAYGAPLQLEEILNGHRLEIKGRSATNKSGWLDVRLVRDLDVRTREAVQTTATSSASASSPPSLPPPSVPSASAPTSAKQKITQYLVRGMRGGEVIILQEFLQKHGWGIPDDGPVTGFFGKVTETAVKKFQESNELRPEGLVGPKTRALINAILAK